MRIRKLAPSGRVEGRWLCHLEDGTILRLGESEVVAFGLGTGKELSGAELSALTEAARAARVREKAVELLSARPLSRKELVEKLTARPRPARDGKEKPAADPAAAEAVADWLEEPSASRMNTPGVAQGNWQWRADAKKLTPALAAEIRVLTERYFRAAK